MRVTVSALHDAARFRLLLTLPHDAVVPFVREWIVRPLPVVRAVKTACAILAVGLVVAIVASVRAGVPWTLLLLQGGLALVANVTLLAALHEGIHALVYLALGAPRVTFGADRTRFVLYAAADGLVLDGPRYLAVALAPLLVINAGLLVLGLLAGRWVTCAAASLLVHTLNGVGDVALVAYVLAQGPRRLYTYDDVTAPRTYFFGEQPAPDDTAPPPKEARFDA